MRSCYVQPSPRLLKGVSLTTSRSCAYLLRAALTCSPPLPFVRSCLKFLASRTTPSAGYFRKQKASREVERQVPRLARCPSALSAGRSVVCSLSVGRDGGGVCEAGGSKECEAARPPISNQKGPVYIHCHAPPPSRCLKTEASSERGRKQHTKGSSSTSFLYPFRHRGLSVCCTPTTGRGWSLHSRKGESKRIRAEKRAEIFYPSLAAESSVPCFLRPALIHQRSTDG